MLTLDQVCAVNDGFKSGDLNAALRPLEETVDLRVNELPRLDKAALAALKTGLQNGEEAATWAEALFHPNISVRRFARKVFMGLGDEGAPLFEPLRDRLQRFWSEVPPLPETNKARDAMLRREQREMVTGAVELLLRSNPEGFLQFYANLKDATLRKGNEEQNKAIQEWQARNSKAWEATQRETERLLTEEWGEEWADSRKRWRLPSRVLRDIDERVRQNPEVMQLWAELGDSPYQRVAAEWHPTALMSGTMNNYLSDYNATGPTRRVAERLQPLFWEWLGEAFNSQNSLAERRKYAERLSNDNGWWIMSQWFGRERFSTEMLPLLLRAKPPLHESIKARLASEESLYRTEEVEEDEVVLARTWLSLVVNLVRTVRMPYNVTPKEWKIPEGMEASTLRELSEGLEASKNNKNILDEVASAADNVEKARLAQSADSKDVPDSEPKTVVSRRSLWTPIGVLSAYEVLSSDQLQAFYKEGDYEKQQALIEAEVRRIEAEAASITDPEERLRILVEPQPLPNNPATTILRGSYWQIWSKELGEHEKKELDETLWKRLEPPLWERLENRLEAYRRTETDPIEPKIEQKLTEREAKEWRAQTRREKRALIQRDILDITNLIIGHKGLQGQLKVVELADRPACRDLRDLLERNLFVELERQPQEYNPQGEPPYDWSKWRLSEEWDVVLAKAEVRLSEHKGSEWEKQSLQRQLATGYYRRGNFEEFKRYAEMPNVSPYVVSVAVLPFDDFEAWRVLLPSVSKWGNGSLAQFWTAQRQNAERKERATQVVVELVSITADEGSAKGLLSWLDGVPHEEMLSLANHWERALESSVPAVRRRAMTILGALEDAEFDRESAAQTAGEALWSETGALAKDAAKFLSQISADDADVAANAWDLLSDATALDNLAVTETVYRALTQIKAKHKDFDLPDAAREKLDDLVALNSERFAKFQKKLA